MFAVGMSILNEEKFVSFAIRSLLACREVDVIAVVEGCVKLNAHAGNEDGLSTDNTAEVIWDTMDKYDTEGRVIFDRFGWAKDKSILQNRCIELSSGRGSDWYLITAGDEIWDKNELRWLAGFLRRAQGIQVVCPTFYQFWHRPDCVAVGSAWSVQQHRFYKIHKGMRFSRHNCPPVGPRGQKLAGRTLKTDRIHIWHMVAMKDEKDILDKLSLYQKRDGHRLKIRPDYWTEWDYEDWKRGVRRPVGWTHGGGSVNAFHGTFPDIIAGDVLWKLLPKRIKRT